MNRLSRHENTIRQLRHEHDFGDTDRASERKTLRVIILTGVTMIAEIVAGVVTGSMALLADGWHMGTHAFALGITYFAYVMARRYSASSRFAFGTGKFGVLSGYTSALFLGGTAVYMIVASLNRFIHPVDIAFDEAIVVAVIGLAVNLLSIYMLHGKGEGAHDHHHDHDHDHDHGHDEEHDHHHDHAHAPAHKHDHNLRAAYLHVIADALTSLLAIVALVSGKFLGWSFLDPVMGIVGGILIGRWAWGLLRSTALILLDGNGSRHVRSAIVDAIEADGDSIVGDLHIWPISSNGLAATISVVSSEPRSPSEYCARLAPIAKLRHTTVEVHRCTDQYCACVKDT